MELYSKNAYRLVFYGCMVMAAFCLACAILTIGLSDWGQANIQEFHIKGNGTIDSRYFTETGSGKALAKDTYLDYSSSHKWGDGTDTIISSFIVDSGSGDYFTQYAVQGAYSQGKVDYSATKISGPGTFESVVTLSANEAGGENFDSQINFDTLDGSAVIRGRVYNSSAGRPATTEELDAVGAFVFSHHLNVSTTFTPDNWLGSCADLDKDMILNPATKGIWIAPLNDSRYNYLYDPVTESITRSLNRSV